VKYSGWLVIFKAGMTAIGANDPWMTSPPLPEKKRTRAAAAEPSHFGDTSAGVGALRQQLTVDNRSSPGM